jgi:hypothetical protein
MDQFECEDNEDFAKRLCDSGPFINFCDDKLENEEDLTNYKMFEAI